MRAIAKGLEMIFRCERAAASISIETPTRLLLAAANHTTAMKSGYDAPQDREDLPAGQLHLAIRAPSACFRHRSDPSDFPEVRFNNRRALRGPLPAEIRVALAQSGNEGLIAEWPKRRTVSSDKESGMTKLARMRRPWTAKKTTLSHKIHVSLTGYSHPQPIIQFSRT
jgi:hypothetical protein